MTPQEIFDLVYAETGMRLLGEIAREIAKEAIYQSILNGAQNDKN